MKALRPTTIPFPSNGQFIRNSTATYIEDGVLKTAAINEPRWQDGKLLLEGEATNYLLNNNTSTPTQYTAGGASGTVVVLSDPFWSNVIRITKTVGAVGTRFGVRYSSAAIPTESFTGGVWIKRPASVVNGKAFYLDMQKTSGGLVTREVSLSAVPPDSWFRASVSGGEYGVTYSSGNMYIWVEGAVGDYVDVALPCIWAGSSDSSAIVTGGVPATREADICIGNFSRASTATYINSSGVLQTAAINVPRIEGNQLLIEEQGVNLKAGSEYFDNTTYWVPSAVSLTANQTGPDGLNTAMKVTETSATSAHSVGSMTSYSGLFTFSLFAKPAERSWIRLRLGESTKQVWFNLSTATIGTAGSQVVSSSIKTLASGWCRVSVTVNSSTVVTPSIAIATADGVESYLGVVSSGLFIFGAQVESNSSPTSYIPTTTTSVTRAADIHSAGLIYTNAIDARPLWSNATTYSIGQVIRYNNTVYESLQNTNLNKQPDTNPTWWLLLGADNISAAFDGKVGSKTTSTDKLRMIIKPGTNIDSIGYIEATASTISTSAIDEDYNLVYSYKSGLDTSIIEDWYDYFFLDPLGDPLTQVVHQGINPLDPNLVIGVEMVRSGTVELGVFVTGQTTAIGKTQYGLRAGIVDYSKKEADEFGNITIVERPYSKRLEGDVYVNNYDLNKVQRFLYNVRATPILWIASDSEELAEVSNVYGFYKDFSTTIAYPDVSMCSLQIEGLV